MLFTHETCFFKDAYSEFAMFFHDVHGGDVIGVVWKPPALEPKDFKVRTLLLKVF